MKMIKSLALIGIGMGSVLLYQKYNKPIMDCTKKKVNCACDYIDDELEEMM